MLNLHFHTLALDGAYPYSGAYGEPPRFWSLPPPSPSEVGRVLAGTARRIERLLASRAEEEDDALARDEPLLAALASASLRTRIADGPQRGEPWRRVGDRVDPGDLPDDPDATPRVPECRGMTLHAAVAVPARDRCRLERLCRYVARPPLAGERLEERADGRLLLRLKTRWRDGTTHIAMERSELIDRLVPLIPPPRAHQVRYHGILAPCASLRSRVVPVEVVDLARTASAGNEVEADASSEPAESAESVEPEVGRSRDDSPEARPRKLRWAALLQRVFGFDALRCPRCGATLRLIAAIEDPAIARRILECLELPARAPPTTPATPGARLDDPKSTSAGNTTRRRPTTSRDPLSAGTLRLLLSITPREATCALKARLAYHARVSTCRAPASARRCQLEITRQGGS